MWCTVHCMQSGETGIKEQIFQFTWMCEAGFFETKSKGRMKSISKHAYGDGEEEGGDGE